MKYGVENYLLEGSLSVTNVKDAISPSTNMLNTNTLRAFIATQDGGDVTISATLPDPQLIDIVAIARLSGVTTDVEIELKLAAASQVVEIVSIMNPVQQTYAAGIFNSISADEIVISFSTQGNADQFEIGHVFAGELSQGLDPESFRVAVISADPFQTTRAGTPETSITYNVEKVEVTLKKLPFSEFRALMVSILRMGYGNPLFWYFDEGCFRENEILLSVLDAETVSMDAFYRSSGEALSNATIGLLEVY